MPEIKTVNVVQTDNGDITSCYQVLCEMEVTVTYKKDIGPDKRTLVKYLLVVT